MATRRFISAHLLAAVLICAALAGWAGPAGAQRAGRTAVDSALAEFRRSGHARVIRSGEAATYPSGYGGAQATCTVLIACAVHLNPDEGAQQAKVGDPQRWVVEGMDGPGGSTIVTVTPKFCDISTNLLISTTRRFYTLALDSPPCGKEGGENPQVQYTREVRWWYPEESVIQLARADSAVAAAKEARDEEVIATDVSGLAPAAIRFAYRPPRRHREFPWLPEQVFNVGETTWILLPTEARQHSMPVLYELDENGNYQFVRYERRGDYVIVGWVLQRAAFTMGGGKPGEALACLIERIQEPAERRGWLGRVPGGGARGGYQSGGGSR